MEWCREVPLLEGTVYRSGNHRGVTFATLHQEWSINGIAPYSQYNALYYRLLVALMATQTWVGNYRKQNTPHTPFVYSWIRIRIRVKCGCGIVYQEKWEVNTQEISRTQKSSICYSLCKTYWLVPPSMVDQFMYGLVSLPMAGACEKKSWVILFPI